MRRLLNGAISVLMMAFAFGGLSSCSKTQESFLTIQTCVINDDGMRDFLVMMASVSKQFELRYVDGSKSTRDGLVDTAQSGRDVNEAARVINIGLEGDAGLGLTAGNLGLAPHQVAIGFTAGRNRVLANRLADTVVTRLSKHWRVISVPAGTGVQRMSGCS